MKRILLPLTFMLVLGLVAQVFSVAPSDELIQKWKAEGTYQQNITFLNNFKARGGCSAEEPILLKKRNSLATANAIDTVRVVVIMVDFSDNPWTAGYQGTMAAFDSILFSDRTQDPIFNNTGSMTDYYMENSYGTFYIVGDIFGWYRMPYTYNEYARSLSGTDTSGLHINFPNAQDLTRHAIDSAEANGVDFSLYDYNNDFNCDGVIIIHSGPGAEVTGDPGDIWSHKWNLRSSINLDGVSISNYNMNPEEFGTSSLSPIGVFCHEYGHFIGLPDLYDTDPTHVNSQGLGYWSLMASGNYTGQSRHPAHMDPWCKAQVGFLSPITVTDNMYNVSIPAVEHNPVAYKLQSGSSGAQYWLVENRQQSGFDSFIPGHGLLIYHIDETKINNNDPLNYKVALEQADGLDQLALNASVGDAGDPFPGFTVKNEFHEFTTPSSNRYDGGTTQIAVWDISASDSIMTCDLDVSYSRPWIETAGITPFVFNDDIGGNSNGIIEAGETIRFFFTVQNKMRWGYDVYGSMSDNNGSLTYTNNDIHLAIGDFVTAVQNPADPIEFVVPDTVTPYIDSLQLVISTDSLSGVPGLNARYQQTFDIEVEIGAPVILIVDDDHGGSYETEMNGAFYEKRHPTDIWTVATQGSPTYTTLSAYDMVFWHTGDTSTGIISTAEINAMKQYLDNGGNLLLTTISGIEDINTLDPTFLSTYFQVSYSGQELLWPLYNGVNGNQITDGFTFRPLPQIFRAAPLLDISGSASPILTTGAANDKIIGTSYDAGTYKSVLLSIGAELIDDAYINTKAELLGKVIEYFGGIATSVSDGGQIAALPKSFDLNQNYPNPFNPTTVIQYTIRDNQKIGDAPHTRLEIFNVLGQKVITLVDEQQIPGSYEVEWDGTTENGQKVSSGLYFYRLTRGNDSETKKMALLK